MKKIIAFTVSWALACPSLCTAAGQMSGAGKTDATSGASTVLFGGVSQPQAYSLLGLLGGSNAASLGVTPELSIFLAKIDAADEAQRASLAPLNQALEIVGEQDGKPEQVVPTAVALIKKQMDAAVATANNRQSTPYQISQALSVMDQLHPFVQIYAPEISGKLANERHNGRTRLSTLIRNTMEAKTSPPWDESAEAPERLPVRQTPDRTPQEVLDAAAQTLADMGRTRTEFLAAFEQFRIKAFGTVTPYLIEELSVQRDLAERKRLVTELTKIAVQTQNPTLLRSVMIALVAEGEKATDVDYKAHVGNALIDVFDSMATDNHDLFDLRRKLRAHIDMAQIQLMADAASKLKEPPSPAQAAEKPTTPLYKAAKIGIALISAAMAATACLLQHLGIEAALTLTFSTLAASAYFKYKPSLLFATALTILAALSPFIPTQVGVLLTALIGFIVPMYMLKKYGHI